MRAPRLRALGLLSPEAVAEPSEGGAPASGRHPVRTLGRPVLPGDKRRRATRECLLALAAVEAMLEDGQAGRDEIAGERTALVYATAAGYGPSNREFIDGGGGIHFAYTAPAVVPAEVAIEFGLTGPYAIFLGGPPATLRAIWQGAALLESGTCDRALVLSVEVFEECADLYARARRLTPAVLVEAAGCLWLEPGRGELTFESGRASGRPGPSAADEHGGMFSGAPLAAVRRWRSAPGAGPLALSGAWRGEHARLVWSESPMARAVGGPTG
jgi:Beta-ketoacyl synthase, N-terminal domain